MILPPPTSTLFPYTTLFRSFSLRPTSSSRLPASAASVSTLVVSWNDAALMNESDCSEARSEEHTSELQSLRHLVCRLLLEKKKKIILRLNYKQQQTV